MVGFCSPCITTGSLPLGLDRMVRKEKAEQLERTLQVDGCVLCPDRHMGYTHTHTFAETHLHETPQTHTTVLVSGYWWFDT